MVSLIVIVFESFNFYEMGIYSKGVFLSIMSIDGSEMISSWKEILSEYSFVTFYFFTA